MPLVIKKVKNGIRFPAFIQPRSSLNNIAGIHSDVLKIRLTASPVDGKANRMCALFLAKLLGVKSSQVFIASGLANRNKVIQIDELSESELTNKLQIALGDSS